MTLHRGRINVAALAPVKDYAGLGSDIWSARAGRVVMAMYEILQIDVPVIWF